MRTLLLLVLLIVTVFSATSQEPKLMLPIGHTAWIKDATFSPDGKKIATVSLDKVAKVWDAETGSLITDLKGHLDGIESVKFSPDTKKLITASRDGTSRIWDINTGKQLLELKGHASVVRYAVFSADGKKALTYGNDEMTRGHKAKVWNASTGTLIATLEGHKSYLNSAEFSQDGTRVLTSSLDNTAKIWDASTGKLITDYAEHTDWVRSAKYSPDGNYVITTSKDKTARIWQAETKMLLVELKGHREEVNSAEFSADGKQVVTASADSSAKVWEVATGKVIADLKGNSWKIEEAKFSPDGKKVIAAFFKTIKTWDANTGKLLLELNERDVIQTAGFSPDGKKILSASWDYTSKIWNAESGRLIVHLKGHSAVINTARFSPDSKRIVIACGDTTSRIVDIQTGRVIASLAGNKGEMTSASYSPDGQYILTIGEYDEHKLKLWDGVTGQFIRELIGHKHNLVSAKFSPDSKLILSASKDSTAMVWDVSSGSLISVLKGHKAKLWSADFNPDGKKVVTAAYDGLAKMWNARRGNLLADLDGHTGGVSYTEFSPDGSKVLTSGAWDGTARVWDAVTGKEIFTIKSENSIFTSQFSPDGKKIITSDTYGEKTEVWDSQTGKFLFKLKWENGSDYGINFSHDGQKIITYTNDKTVGIWSSVNGKLIMELNGHSDFVNYAEFSPDGTKIVTGSDDNTTKIWDAATGDLIYTFLTVDNSEFLVLDKEGRYDGSEAARDLLYFTCGTQIIALDQVKDQLWVPNLAERIVKGETINAPKLSDLNICGLTPVVENTQQGNNYHFTIQPRKGGLGETVLYVNGIEVKRYKPEQLGKTKEGFELNFSAAELKDYFKNGEENAVTIKSFTAKNDIASRAVRIIHKETNKLMVPPNLFAVMVGVSDYKGEELDLKYAAKDAQDLSNAVSAAAKKLLNTDSKEHVFMYNINTGDKRTSFPEKQSIKKAFEEIGKKATANDILMIFFAGHGIMEGENKQFYFLTADASKNGDIPSNSISIHELSEWMKPANIKAQKRILIFDACNSGQAINDLVTIGTKDQDYAAARNDEESNRIKAVEKLNERSGLFILSASASNQNAYELGRYSQGVLTYALLKAIKDQPEILEDGKYLSVDKWFAAAEKSVTDIISQTGNRQQPQKFGAGGFNIGVVDNEVIAKIVLPQEKPLFTASNFINPSVGDDDLELTNEINKQLYDISVRGADSKLTYITATKSPEAYTLTGTYEVQGAEVVINVNIKQKKEIKYRLKIKGKKGELNVVAADVVKSVEEWIGNK